MKLGVFVFGMGGIAFLKNGTVLEKIPRYH